MAVDLIYNMQRAIKYDPDTSGFFFADSLRAAVRTLPAMRRDRGTLGATKLVIKIVLGRCCYFGLTSGSNVLSTGVLALGYCRFYAVPADAIVIGEIETPSASRGKGHATRAIKLAVDAMIRKGATNFYIDTQRQNIPMIKAIAKLGFGQPVGGIAAISGDRA